MRGAGLECLVTTIRRNLVLLILLAFVVSRTAITVFATLPLVVLIMIRLVMFATTAIARVMLFCNTADFLLVTHLERVTKLVLCVILDLMLAFPCKGAINHL